jgi:hypothetical protein
MHNSRSTRSSFSDRQTASAFAVIENLGAVRSDIRDGLSNPLEGILTNDAYSAMRSNDLINEKALRDYIIRQMFVRLKAEGNLRTQEAITQLVGMYPYLQHDTIRKIVYRVYPSSSRKSMM